MYKTKDKKIHPRDDVPSDGSTPEGDPLWKVKNLAEARKTMQPDTGPFAGLITPKFSSIQAYSRLKPDRLEELMGTVSHLTEKEKELFLAVLLNREAALCWEFEECGSIDHKVAPPQVIRTVPHKAWREKGIPIPKALEGAALEILRTRLRKGILEEGHGPNRNPWFLVKKKDGSCRLINSATRMNGVTIRDAFAPPGAENFSEDFGMCEILSLLDIWSGYDQVPLAEESRDLTTFATPLGLLRMCTLPQGATNSPAQFMRIMTRILYDLIPHCCRAFLDDIVIKGPTTTYNDECLPDQPGIRRYVYEHLQNIDKVLLNIELAGCTIAVKKSQWLQKTATVVGYLCGSGGRRPDQANIIKIMEWKECSNLTEVRSFVGMTGFYKIWIEKYSEITIPFQKLMKKNATFQWGPDQANAMSILKEKLTSAPILISIDYSSTAGQLIIGTDASFTGWGAHLSQAKDGKRAVARYESGIWRGAELKYDSGKLELRAVLMALKKLRNYVYGVKFLLETDAQVLVAQLNGGAHDLPGALITRWIAWIRLFDFEVKHIPGTKNVIADALSRKPPGQSDLDDYETPDQVEDFIDSNFYFVSVHAVYTSSAPNISKSSHLFTIPDAWLRSDQFWSNRTRQMAFHLKTLLRPDGILAKDFRKFKAEAWRYMARDGYLYTRPTKRHPVPRRLIDDPKIQDRLIRHAHVESGHRGRDATFHRLALSYIWKDMYRHIQANIATCQLCQRARSARMDDWHIGTTPGEMPFTKISLDIQWIGPWALVEARCDMTGWIEARRLAKPGSDQVADFIWEDIFCRHGVCGQLLVDGGPENKGAVDALNAKYGVTKRVISAYNSRANGVNEQGHKPIAHTILTWSEGGTKDWGRILPTALFADRTTVRAPTGYTPFFLTYGYEAITPIEESTATWRVMDWGRVRDHDQELAARTRSFQQLDHDREVAAKNVSAARQKTADRYNDRHSRLIRPAKLQPGDLVLVFDEKRAIDKSKARKLQFRWQGPLRVHSVSDQSGSYRLETLGGEVITRATYSGHRLKRYFENATGFWESENPLWAHQKLRDELAPYIPTQDHQDELWELDCPPEPDQAEDIALTRAKLAQLELEKQNETLRQELAKWKATASIAIEIPTRDPDKDNEYLSVPDIA